MLKREQDTITNMAYNAWYKLQQADQLAYNEARASIAKTFETDPRTVKLLEALDEFGCLDGQHVVSTIASGGSIGFKSIRFHPSKGVRADINAAESAIPAPKARPNWHSSTASAELALAVSRCKSKWTELQGPLYSFVADLNMAKDEAEIEAAVRIFTAAIV